MTRMFAPDPGCYGATVGRSGKRYDRDRTGFLQVDDPKDAQRLREAGFVQAGATPATSRHWLCECGWEAWINSCPRCERTDLTRIEA